jgi:hypothetical protein
MVLHEAMNTRGNTEEELFPPEMPALMPLDSMENAFQENTPINPLPFFIFGDDEETDDDIDEDDNFDDMEDDFEDDDFDDDDFDDEDEDDDYDYEEDVDYDDFDE